MTEVDVVFLDFRNALDTILQSILLDKLSRCEMSRCTLCCMKNWPVGIHKHFLTERMVSHWRRFPKEVVDCPIPGGILKGSIWTMPSIMGSCDQAAGLDECCMPLPSGTILS